MALFPENWPAWALFCAVSTQWRTNAMGGYTGLDYGILYPLLDRQTSNREEWSQLFADIQHIEREALATMRSEKDT